MTSLDTLLKAIANKRRIAILKYLQNGRRSSVSGIATHIKLSFKATSKHLAILTNVGVLEKEQKALIVWHFFAKKKHPLVVVVLRQS